MTIHTRWHRFMEGVKHHLGVEDMPEDELTRIDNDAGMFIMKGINYPLLVKAVKYADEQVDKFYVSPELIKMMDETDITKSLSALYEAGLADHLPLPVMMFEFEAYQATQFVVLAENSRVDAKPLSELPFSAFVFSLRYNQHMNFAGVCPAEVETGLKRGDDGEIVTQYVMGPASYINPTEDIEKIIRHGHKEMAAIVGVALEVALLMFHTKGVEKEVIQSDRLNKHRVRSGKVPIPTYSVIRIGHVYDRHGKSSKFDTRRPVRVHWRKAHTRQQRYGQGLNQTKMVYIAPVLVNYKEGDEMPAPRRSVVKW